MRPALSPIIQFLCSLILISLAGCVSQRTPELRVLTFNIHHGETVDGRMDWQAMAEIIRSAGPHLVALQEVDVHTSRVSGISLVEELANYCGMEFYFAKALDYGGGEYGNAVLSTYPIINASTRDLPGSPGHEARVAAECLVALPSDTVLFISTHFDHLREQPDRPAQAGALLEAHRNNEVASILAGDLNDVPDSEAIETLTQYWTLSGDAGDFTIPVDSPNRKIDYILHAPRGAWSVISSRVLPDIVSDHLAVLTVFKKAPAQP